MERLKFTREIDLRSLDLFFEKKHNSRDVIEGYKPIFTFEKFSKNYLQLKELVSQISPNSLDLSNLIDRNIELYRDLCNSSKTFEDISEKYRSIQSKTLDLIKDRYQQVHELQRELPKQDYELNLIERLKTCFGKDVSKVEKYKIYEVDTSWKDDEEIQKQLKCAYDLIPNCLNVVEAVLHKKEDFLSNDKKIDEHVSRLCANSKNNTYVPLLKELSLFILPSAVSNARSVQINLKGVLESYASVLV